MLFNECGPPQMENFPDKELNGIVQTKSKSPQAVKLLKFSIFCLIYILYTYILKKFCLSVSLFKRMILYNLKLYLFGLNIKMSYLDITDMIKLHFCFTISLFKYRDVYKQISDSSILFFC